MLFSSDDIQQERIACKFHPFVVQGNLLAGKSSPLILIHSTRYGCITERERACARESELRVAGWVGVVEVGGWKGWWGMTLYK